MIQIYMDNSDWKIYGKDLKPIQTEDTNPEIDENIAFSISLLNKKGYRTQYCCEGHAYRDKKIM